MALGAVIFDLFGTLVDSFSVVRHERAVTEMAAVLDVPRDPFDRLFSDETYPMRATGVFSSIAALVEYVCKRLDAPIVPERVAAAVAIHADFIRANLVPRDDAVETLVHLKAVGFKTGLISDCSIEVSDTWHQTAFGPLIDAPIFSCAVGVTKPDPRIYHAACVRLDLDPTRCLYVGDGSSQELSGAARVGMQPVLYRISLHDAYDVDRPDVANWPGPTVTALREVVDLVGNVQSPGLVLRSARDRSGHR